MRFLQILVFLGLVAAVIYLWFFRKPEQIITIRENTTIIAETPIKRLSAFVDAHHGSIFAPLTDEDTIMPSQEIRQIQATLRDLQAGTEVDARRLSDMRAKGFDAPMANPRDREKESQRKQEFFEGGVHRSWETTSTRIMQEVNRQYDYMRLLER